MQGWVVLWKPCGSRCTQLDRTVKRCLGKSIKVGHAGTLDPFAEGILPIAFGAATRMIPFILRFPKTYRFTCVWGAATDTEDGTGTVLQTNSIRPSYEAVRNVLPQFIGKIAQRPCAYSAIKIQGVPAYTWARKGSLLILPKKEVTIYSLNILTPRHHYTGHEICLEVTCSSGTYVRALARDLAQALGALAHVSSLVRTCVGPFTAEQALPLEHVAFNDPQSLVPWVYPLDYGVERLFPCIHLKGEQVLKLWQGLEINLSLPFFSEFWVCKYQENMVCLSKGKVHGLVPYRCFINTRVQHLLNMEKSKI